MIRQDRVIRAANIAVIVSFILLSACSNPAVPPPEPRDPGRWLILVHLGIDNNIDYDFEDSFAVISNYVATLESLEAADSEDVLDIVVLMDSYNDDVHGNGYITPFQDGYYRLTGADFASDLMIPISEVKSGDVQESKSFIDWAWANYPADYVVYSVFNHGGGFDDLNEMGTYGIAFDDSHDDSLSHRELSILTSYIKSKTGRNIDLFYPYACLMGGMELGYELRDSVDFMTFSEEVFPAELWSWEGLEAILNNPSISGRDLGGEICDSALAYFSQPSVDREFTLATVDLSQMDGLAAALDSFASTAIGYIQGDLPRASALDYAAGSGVNMLSPYYLDLKVLMNNVKLTAPSLSSRANTVLSRLNSAVTKYRYYGAYYADAGGLSIFHNFWGPMSVGIAYPPDLYKTILDFGTNRWADYVQLMTELSPSLADAYEPDYPATTNQLSAGAAAQYHTFHVAGDTDVMFADLVGGQVYTIQTFPGAAYSDTYLILVGTDGSTVLADNDDIDFENDNYYSKIVYTPGVSGRYFIICDDYYDDGGSYRISLRAGTYSTVSNLAYFAETRGAGKLPASSAPSLVPVWFGK